MNSRDTFSQTAAVSQIYETLREPIRNFIAKRISERSDVEDLVHDVFLKIHKRIDTLKEPGKLTSWVYQIARNSVTDYYKSRKETVSGVDEDLVQMESVAAPDIGGRLSRVVRTMMEQLPDNYRIPLKLADLDHVKHRDIADQLGISLPGVKSRVQRARRMLKDLLLECCHFEFDKYGTVFDYSARNCTRCCPGGPKETGKVC